MWREGNWVGIGNGVRVQRGMCVNFAQASRLAQVKVAETQTLVLLEHLAQARVSRLGERS